MLIEDCFQALIFCATRRMAIQSANQLVKTLGERNESYVVGGQQQRHSLELFRSAKTKALQNCSVMA
jgi:replicative superfamily II helicase